MTAPENSIDQYHAFQTQNGFYINRDATVLALAGTDRLGFLHNFCTADIKALDAGDSTEAFVLDPKGKTLFFVEILAGQDQLVLVVPKSQQPALAAHLNRYIIVEDVEINHLEQSCVVYASWEFEGAFPSHLAEGTFCGVLDDRSVAQGWRDELEKIELSKETFEMIRVENRFPVSGIDVLEDSLAQEFERDDTAISFNKGCYLGQETVARLDALGHTNRSFCMATTDSDPASILDSELSCEGKVCGRATSAAWSPRFDSYLVLVMAKKPFHVAGSQMQLGTQSVTVIG